jgi:hypothetical protein
MGSISFQVVETGQTTLTKTYTLADSQVDRLVAAYQVAANASISGTATRAQVLNFWVQGLVNETVQQVQNVETAALIQAVVPPGAITPV